MRNQGGWSSVLNEVSGTRAHLRFFGGRTFLSASGLPDPITPIILITPIPCVVLLEQSKMRTRIPDPLPGFGAAWNLSEPISSSGHPFPLTLPSPRRRGRSVRRATTHCGAGHSQRRARHPLLWGEGRVRGNGAHVLSTGPGSLRLLALTRREVIAPPILLTPHMFCP